MKSRGTSVLAVLLPVFLLLLASEAFPETYVLQPGPGANDGTDDGSAGKGKDTGTRNWDWGEDDSNFGAWNHAYLVTATWGQAEAFVRFSTEGLPTEGVTLAEAGINMEINKNGPCDSLPGDPLISAYPASGDWDEMTLTWNNQPLDGLPAADTRPLVGVPGLPPLAYQWVTFDITGLYRAWIDGSLPNHGLRFAMDTPAYLNCNAAIVMYTSDAAGVNEWRPMLRVTTGPACGNGIVNVDETCDDGNLIDGDGCDSNCTATACGNGVVTDGEACDDGNLIDGDGCEADCTLSPPRLLFLTAPAPGTVWLNDGSARTITWTCQNVGGDVRLYLWQGESSTGHEVMEIAASVPCADETFTWTPPDALADAVDYAAAVESLLSPTLGHEIGPLAIQHLHLTSPNKGKLYQGSTYTITWESSGLAGATVRLDLYDGEKKVRTIAAATPNDGSHSWKVPFTQAPGNAFRVRVSTTDPFAAEDYSDRAFRILPAVTLTAPNGGQSWKRGTTQTIRWTYKNAPGTAVRLELYKNDVFHSVIAASVPIGAAGAGSYLWKIPVTLPAGTTYTVKVRSATWAKVFDFSNKMFTITK